jgi:hypothetical protein
MLMSLHFLVFPSLMVHFNLCSFNIIIYKSLDENIMDQVPILLPSPKYLMSFSAWNLGYSTRAQGF